MKNLLSLLILFISFNAFASKCPATIKQAEAEIRYNTKLVNDAENYIFYLMESINEENQEEVMAEVERVKKYIAPYEARLNELYQCRYEPVPSPCTAEVELEWKKLKSRSLHLRALMDEFVRQLPEGANPRDYPEYLKYIEEKAYVDHRIQEIEMMC